MVKITKKLEDQIRKFISKRYGGRGRRWEIKSEEQETMFQIYRSEVEELIDMIKKA